MARDLVCFSHLRWDFVYQRPNHLMARAAADRRVYFVEEPVDATAQAPWLATVERDGVTVVTPHLPVGLTARQTAGQTARMLARLIEDHFAAALHPHQRVQVPHGAAPCRDDRRARIPTAAGDPYYPIPRPENKALYERYLELASAPIGVHSSGAWRRTSTTAWTRS